MAFTEDFSAFFDTDEFAVSATFTPRTGGDPSTIDGIFDSNYLAVDTGAEVGVVATQPIFLTATSGLTNPRGGTLVVNSTTYDIVDHKPDGTGHTLLVLEEQ